MISGVVLDLDGVIVDSEHLWEESWVACCQRRGAEWARDDTTACQGMSPPEWARYIAEKLGEVANAPGDAAAPGGAEAPGAAGAPAPDVVRAIQEECVDDVIAAIAAGHAPLLDGAGALIAQVGAQVPLALASSAARRVIDAVLRHHEIADRFKATVSSEEGPRGKPSPDVYAEAARRIGVTAGTGIAIEDSGNGIRAAHAAGLSVVAIPNPLYPPHAEALELADHVATDHGDALDYLLARLR